ncbi:hypothetical protein SCHPADRAFT_839666 [Schizopora paradoxa]|uniref:Uncharacterized protein n=1 Tax=Schizopora paradoxa TaxID=27342 RepID=A0A0H2R0G5_9AGAM|nr:hypothetical protein SCHPADRAFT_839666 [Schizopora paradoxa]
MNNTCFTFPSLAPGQAAWAADPSCRGSFGIALLCLSTTIICIWSSVHRDIPLKRLPTMPSLIRDAPLVLVALFAPELMFYFALNQYLCARNLNQPGQNTTTPPRKHTFTLNHGFYAAMGGFAIKHVDSDGVETSPRKKLTYEDVAELMKENPDLFPDLSLESITDREKSTNLAKALLIVQVLWFCLNCISRLAEQLPLSLLEVTTLAHGLFTLLSYAMWWSKPLNVEEPTWIAAPSRHYSLTELALAQKGYCRYLIPNAGPDAYVTFESVPRLNSFLFDTGLSFTMENMVYARALDYIVSSCIPLLYGLVHFLALSAQFPTSTERNLWRIGSVVIMSSGVLAVTSEIIVDVTERASWTRESLRKAVRRVSDLVWNIIIPAIYTICSGYLLVESIRQLWYLPHDAYVVASWTYYIPHWA